MSISTPIWYRYDTSTFGGSRLREADSRSATWRMKLKTQRERMLAETTSSNTFQWRSGQEPRKRQIIVSYEKNHNERRRRRGSIEEAISPLRAEETRD